MELEQPPGNGTFTGSVCSAGMTTSSPQRQVVRFPAEKIARAGTGGAAKSTIWKGRAREWLGRALNWARVPGAIRNIDFTDSVTGQALSVSVDELFVRLTVDGRDYYFDRLTGRFDGTGSAASQP